MVTYTLEKMLTDYRHIYDHFGMNEYNILCQFGVWAKKRSPIVSDYAWYIFNMLLEKNAEITDNERDREYRNAMLYGAMVYFRREVENADRASINKIQRPFNTSTLNYQLMDLGQAGHFLIEIVSGQCCPFCDTLDGRKYEIEDYLKNEYLASPKCTRESGCNCCFSLLPKRDKNGHLSFLKG